MNPSSQSAPSSLAVQVWQRVSAAFLRGFRVYGTWLAGISWWRFALLSVVLMMATGIMQNLPPFSWSYTETVVINKPKVTTRVPAPPEAPRPPPVIRIEKPDSEASGARRGVDISIDKHGIRIQQRADLAAAQASAAASVSGGSLPASVPNDKSVEIDAGDKSVRILLPTGADSEEVKAAVEEARAAVVEAIEDARQARADAADAVTGAVRGDNGDEGGDIGDEGAGTRISTRTVQYGDSLPPLGLLWILASAVIKATYKGRLQAEVKAARATETAEAESLKRQVVEARMAAMQAQVEPHFLFNTLASIDHLIETDPPRASQMQKNLIALLRASMPTMRDTGDGGARDLGRELAVVRPYVEILKVRMEERLDASLDVPEGLLSAEFPAMMIQTLVENAIRHGLEPKPEGGTLRVKAEIVHGKLAVTVSDTGVGFGNAATAGTGVGLANIRERLQLLHGGQASLTVTANQPSGTVVTITVPYRTIGPASSRMAA